MNGMMWIYLPFQTTLEQKMHEAVTAMIAKVTVVEVCGDGQE